MRVYTAFMPSADTPKPKPARAVALPESSVLVAGARQAAWLSPDGEIALLPFEEAARRARNAAPIVCHARALARRLGVLPFPALDVLELFAFARPAQFCLPTPRGLALATGLTPPGRDLASAAAILLAAAGSLLAELAAAPPDEDARAIALAMERGGWGWGQAVLAALPPAREGAAPAGMAQWRRLPEWAEMAPEPGPGNIAVEGREARARLAQVLGPGAEARPQQADYAEAVSAAFGPREREGEPQLVLAEAGTGVGKTMGYIAPASLWAEKNEDAVWVSTYTRNLQHQITGELDRLYPDPAVKERRVVLRKGRENYLCLLNFEEAVAALPMRPYDAAPLGIMARWVGATRDGDMVGGDMPGWFPDVIGRAQTLALADRRGECIHSACLHYHRCFIEKSVRRARRARIVVANHALVMIQAALGGLDDNTLPQRYVFDEGHHVFDAADSAFSLELGGREAAELRRWLVGAEERGRSRARGLRRRIEDLVLGDATLERALAAVTVAARVLPADGFLQRIIDGRPQAECEAFLAVVRQQVLARATGRDQGYSLETELRPPVDGLVQAARALANRLDAIEAPMRLLAERLARRLEDEAADLDTAMRVRIEAAVRGLTRRGAVEIGGWRRMLEEIEKDKPPEFVDWLAVERIDGQEVDLGMHRHWVDPTRPFAELVAKRAHGVLVTSATLTDGSGDPIADWEAAEARTGAKYLATPALRARVPSPFDYKAQTRVFIVTDVRREEVGQVAAAYRELILAAGGGALGLFTAISRLKAVHALIAEKLEQAGLPLLAQHVDGMDTATLVDIFRAEEDASLLGTDALRDGVDVPGRSLRLIVFDRVPWPRPDIVHKARRAAFGGARYDDSITRLRLRQAFGRLVRRADDCGVFVLLDRQLPTRLLGAFPEGVPIERVGLKDAVARTASFLRRD
ncbi:MAG TPA: ATP-dependent DNA helicase [Stellaceae bacterium]|nr:ATP-dependent DNA helicase [Stellaceae bacterium]